MGEEFKRMQKLAGIITEDKQTYDYGCVMIYFDFPTINKIHDSISPDDIYTEDGDGSFGIEDEPHTTLLYGLHKEVDTDTIKNILGDYEFDTCTISNASLFENEKFDVLKFDVSGVNLKEANNDLTIQPHTTDYPNFHPHLTIAYLKPGTGKKYTKILEGEKFELKPQYVIYSKPDGGKDKINIKVKN